VYSSSGANPSQSYGASPAIWDHSVTCHPTQLNASHLNSSQIGRYSIYLPRRDGRLSWSRRLAPYRDGHQVSPDAVSGLQKCSNTNTNTNHIYIASICGATEALRYVCSRPTGNLQRSPPELPKLDYRGLFVRLWEGKKKQDSPKQKFTTTPLSAMLFSQSKVPMSLRFCSIYRSLCIPCGSRRSSVLWFWPTSSLRYYQCVASAVECLQEFVSFLCHLLPRCLLFL